MVTELHFLISNAKSCLLHKVAEIMNLTKEIKELRLLLCHMSVEDLSHVQFLVTAVSQKNEVTIWPKFDPSALKLNYSLKSDFILKDYHINLFSIKFCICYMLFDSKCIDSFRNFYLLNLQPVDE